MVPHYTVYPILCEPLFKPKIWGGRKLEVLFGMDLPAGEKIGEAWVAADLAEGSTRVANGPLTGASLGDAARLWGEAMIGPAWRGRPTGARFPLLVKFLDAQDDLSIQVHPDEAACRSDFPDDFSKDESWIVLDATPGGAILHGFVAGVTLDDFDRLLAEGRVVECMRRIEVRPGDVFRVAPGTVHALCRGVAILEIQEPSDSTFRIYDYGRLGDDGEPRPLHLDAARKVMRFESAGSGPRIRPAAATTSWGWRETLVDVAAYRIECVTFERPTSWRVDPRSAQTLIVLEGEVSLAAGGDALRVRNGGCVALPAAVGTVRVDVGPGGAPARAVLAGAGGVEMIPAR